MARYKTQIDTLKSSQTAINGALTDKLSESVSVKLSGVADEIRRIETGNELSVRFSISPYALGQYSFVVASASFSGSGEPKGVGFRDPNTEYNGSIVLPYGSYSLEVQVMLTAPLANDTLHLYYSEGSYLRPDYSDYQERNNLYDFYFNSVEVDQSWEFINFQIESEYAMV